MHVGVSVHIGKKQNKTPPLHSLRLERFLSEERNQGCPEIENVAENWDRVAHNTIMWRMLSHIRTQKTCRALPQGLFEGHTNSPCWETNVVSLFAGSLCWRHDLLGLWVPYSHRCLATSATTPAPCPLPQSPSCLRVTFRLNFLYSPVALCFLQNLL